MILPDAALAQHIAITGRTGSGKTFAAKGFVEHLLDLGRRVCIIDPTDAWFGLRSSADGSRPGYPVIVFGGDHADVPINAHSGAALAEFVATQNAPSIIATADMHIDERRRFMADFLDGLYRLNKGPLHLIVDEADEIGPQNPMPDTKVVLHRIDRIVRRGRIRGFRVIMITQRPAVLNKNLLTQASTLIAMRLMAPQDRKAIDAWIEGQGDVAKGKEVLGSLATLRRGEGWVWSPDFDILKRVEFPRIKTFDSSRAPTEGETAEPTKLADVDLTAIRQAFAAAEAEAAANDPKLLRKRIAELEREAKRAQPEVDPAALEAARMEGRLEERQRIADDLARGRRLDQALDEFRQSVADLVADLTAPPTVPWDGKPLLPASPPPPAPPNRRATAAPPPRRANGAAPAEPMSKAMRSVLIAVAQYPHGRTRAQIGILSGYSPSSGHFDNTLGTLRTKGWIEGGRGAAICATAAGRAALGDFDPLPEGDELRQMWLGRLGKAERALLAALIDAYPRGLNRSDLGRVSGYSETSGHFDNCLGRLRTLELVVGQRGEPLRASDDLMRPS